MNDDRILELVTAALDSVAPGWNKDVESLDLSMKMKELSIDSVSTMEMVGYIEEQLGVTFPDEDLAQVSRLEDLAGLIRKAAA
jgi:acyl carrier protein